MTVLPDEDLPLAGDLPETSPEQWQALLPGLAQHIRRGARDQDDVLAGWDLRRRHAVPDNSAVLADLENGAGSLWLVVGADAIPVIALDRVLGGVHLGLTPIVLDAGAETAPAAAELLRLCDAQGVARRGSRGGARGGIRGNLGADPLGHEARTGEVLGFGPAAYLARRCADTYPALRALTVDALPYHQAGGSAAQELGCALATGVAYLRELDRVGLSGQQAASQLEFRYAATADPFLTIAKLRAARRLWARAAEAPGAGDPRAQRQHAVTAAMMTRPDPWTNTLRTMIAALSAGVGGAEAVTVLPFDARGLSDGPARRIAPDTSTLLMGEPHLARVIDPADDSWYVEKLTDELAHAGWDFFQGIGRAGGQAKALRSGMIADRLARTWSARARLDDRTVRNRWVPWLTQG